LCRKIHEKSIKNDKKRPGKTQKAHLKNVVYKLNFIKRALRIKLQRLYYTHTWTNRASLHAQDHFNWV